MDGKFLKVMLVVGTLILVALPWIVPTNTALTIATQTLVWTVMALSYNIVFGQTGLLSFCHAVFFGAGAFAASYVVNAAAGSGVLSGIPLWLMPVPAFAAGALVALLLGLFLARRTGVAFVMITMALATLVVALVENFKSIFGGASGVSIDRAYQSAFMGLTNFGQQRDVYWLVLAWTLIAAFLMWLLTATSLGKLSVATRENEERVRFSGQSTYNIRLTAMVLGGGFAGLAGALHCINIEQVSTEQFSLKTSAFALFMCVIGGPRAFYGPVLGAVLLSVLDKVLPNYTVSWPLYLGLVFCSVLLFSPGGLVTLVNGVAEEVAKPFQLKRLATHAARVGLLLILTLGVIMAVEMAAVLSSQEALKARDQVNVLWFVLNPTSGLHWLMSLVLIVAGVLGASQFSSRSKSAANESVASHA